MEFLDDECQECGTALRGMIGPNELARLRREHRAAVLANERLTAELAQAQPLVEAAREAHEWLGGAPGSGNDSYPGAAWKCLDKALDDGDPQ